MRFATPNVNASRPNESQGAISSVTQTSKRSRAANNLPAIDFSRINKLRVHNNVNGTGAELREDLICMGGTSKFFRTKRLNMLINKPASMFEGTHLQTSSRVHEIQDACETTKSIIQDLDTSFCERYDEPGVSGAALRTISQNHKSIIHRNFDYTYLQMIEGTSPMNIKRKSEFNEVINHMNNPNKIISDQMTDHYNKTIHSK